MPRLNSDARPQMQPSLSRRCIAITALAVSLVGLAYALALSQGAAVALAESFIAKNGYTTLPREQINRNLHPESLELYGSREEQLRQRFNTLEPKAIGIKRGARGRQNGWSVAFEYVGASAKSETCRVVTMDEDGTNLTVQHVNGIRKYFAGFD